MRLLIGVLMALSAPAFGWQARFSITATVPAPIPNAFSAANVKSLIAENLVGPHELCIFNETADRMDLNNQTYDTSTPSSATVTHTIPAGGAVCITTSMAKRTFLQSQNGAGTTVGVVHGWID